MSQANGSRWFYSFVPHGMAGGATSTLIPLFAYALGGNLADVGIIAAATSIASVPAFLLWGLLSDRIGRRRVFLLVGFLGSGLSFALMALCGTMSQFYLANLLIGFLGAASGPVSAVLVMETSERKKWPSKLAFLSRLSGVGWVVGLALGVAWLTIGPVLVGELGAMRALFVIGAALGLLSGILAASWLAEPTVRVERRDVHLVDIHFRVERVKYLPMRLLHYVDPRNHRGSRVRLARPLRTYLLSVFLLFGGFTAFYGFFPIFLKEAYALTSPQVFVVFIASQVTSAAFYPRVGRWVSDHGGRRVQLYASLGRAVLFPSFFLVALAPLPWEARFATALALHAGVGLCWAMINVAGSTLVSRLAPDGARAQALGAFNSMQGFGSILGPLVGGFVAQGLGYAGAFASSAAFILAGAVILAVNRVSER
ncbi:MAG: hypothetical protein A3K66_03425 [Euryarchaeota archaeon RBG_16_67_27]|nr:MAG: hypothetical protein A3K66_03425 [Euryarchaeota archaeon RBG_16_67_27]